MKEKPLVVVDGDAPLVLLEYLASPEGPGQPVAARYRPHGGWMELLPWANALIIRNQTRVDDSLLKRASRLKVIGRIGAGLDNIDQEAATRRGITVVYSPWGNTVSTAEFAITLIMTLARRVPYFYGQTRRGLWERSATGWELAGRTLGILGFGAVGRHVARIAAALNMKVITHHPRLRPDHPDLTTLGVAWVDEEELLRRSEILSVHLPARPDTYHYLDRRRLSLLPRGALLVNTSRGTVIDEDALAKLLAAGRLGGAALDVRAQEPPPQPDPLARFDNVIITPHVGGLTGPAQERVCLQVAWDVRRVLAGLQPLHPAF